MESYELIGVLMFALIFAGLLLTGLQKIAPSYYWELFFVIVMIVVNVFTGILAILVAAVASQTGNPWLAFIVVEGFPFLLFLFSFFLLIRKLKKISSFE